VNPIQVAQDYAAEEGFDCAINEDGSADVFYPRGTARVFPDGHVKAAANPRLKAVLEKKIAAARAKEAQLQQDPSGRITIKFSDEYEKMPPDTSQTRLLGVLKVKRHQLSAEFLEWDTKFRGCPGNFPLSAASEFLVLMLLSDVEPTVPRNPWLEQPRLWTTIRAAWPPEKEEYYRLHIGEIVNIEIQGGR
jgi:hypothetical protein